MGDYKMQSIKRINELRKMLLAQLEHGCQNGYCSISGKAKGMHTNGGCRCKKDVAELCLDLAVALDDHPQMYITPCLDEL